MWRGKYELKSFEILGSLFSWEGWEQKEGTECSHELSQGKQYGKTEKIHVWKECTVKVKALKRDLLGTRCVSLINSHCLHLWQREKGEWVWARWAYVFSAVLFWCSFLLYSSDCSTRSVVLQNCLAYIITQASVGRSCHWFSLEVTVMQKPFVFSELSKSPPPVS